MSHKLWRLRESLYNTPLLVDTETFESVINYLDARNKTEEFTKKAEDDYDGDNSGYQRYLYNPDTQTAVMAIEGPLSYKPVTFMGFDCGGTSYTGLKEDVESAIELGAKTIVFSVDSGGGMAHGMIDSAQYIRTIADQAGVEILAFVDGRSASAAYGLSVIADEIIMSSDSDVGSVGVLVQLMNDSKALEKEGYERSFIYAGADKQPFEPDGSFRQSFLDNIQEGVDECYEKFTSHVAQMRGLSVDAVKSTEANMYSAEDAIKLGLADKVMTPENFYSYLADKAQSNMENTPMNVNRIFKFAKTEEVQKNMSLEDIQTQLAEAVQAKAEMSTQLEALMAEKEGFAEMLTSLQASKEAAETELATFKLDTKLSTRKAALSQVVAADRVESLTTAFASLDDASFQIALEGFGAQKKAIEQSDMMQELGGEGVELEAVAESKKQETDPVALTKAAMAKMKPKAR